MLRKMLLPVAFGAGAIAALPAQAATNLVTNGDFSAYSGALGGIVGYNGGFDSPATVTGWTNTGYNFLMNGSVDDNGGVRGPFGNFQLWGPDNGSANGLAESKGGTGGNYIAADSDASHTGTIYQTINNLIAGQQYAVTFDWAAAEQKVNDQSQSADSLAAPTTESWLVSLDNSALASSTTAATMNAYTKSTSIDYNAAKGFVPWTSASMIFTARGTSQTLSFLAQGGPNGKPPMALLDNVALSAVPETSTWAMMLVGFAAIGGAVRRKRAGLAVA